MSSSPLPPLKSLHLFSVAAKHLNFSKAAEELCITPSAVSHQVKNLEDWLGCRLFEKNGKQLVLTAKAQTFALQIHQSLDQIRQATCEITSYKNNRMQLGVTSAFAMKRLMPALESWQLANPDIDLRIRMLNCEDKPETLELDAVLANRVDHVGYQSAFIQQESYHPMCSPALAEQANGLSMQQIMQTLPLIDIDQINIGALWMADKHLQLDTTPHPIFFSHTLLLLQAALYGQGIAFLEKSLVQNELASGELVCLSDEGFVPHHTAYFFSWNKHRRHDPTLLKLQNWIQELFS